MADKHNGFEADLKAMEQAIHDYIDKAIDHFKACKAGFDTLAKSDLRPMASSTEGTPGQAIPGCTSDAVKGMQTAHNKLLDSLHHFRDTLQDVVDTYRGTEQQNAQHFHSLTKN